MNKTESVREAQELRDLGSSELPNFGRSEVTNFGSARPIESMAEEVRNFQTSLVPGSASSYFPNSETSELTSEVSS